ncbi:MAG TPA: condensation domain-containing protein, partial [Pseudonocardiaceae bacterium]|nr:condensation domain-containing protein [Pseudonocardiaceae bacterium]
MAESTPKLSDLTPAQRAALVRQLTERRAAPTGIPRRPLDVPARLSMLQEQLWLVDQLDESQAAAYNVPAAIHMDGPLDVPTLRRSLAEIVRRHESLRSVVEVRDDVPYQVVRAPQEMAFEVEDRAGVSETALLAELVADGSRHIDLAAGPVIRFRLFRLAPDRHLLFLTAHHAFFDGWSLEVVLSELTDVYRAFRSGAVPPLSDTPVQYADFAVWQRDRLRGDVLERHLRYWENQLRGMTVLNLPTDRPRPPVPSSRGDSYECQLDAETSAKARTLAATHAATPYMVVMTAFAMMLARHTGQEDVVVGTSNAGRDRTDLENVVGLLTNMNVMRFDLGGDPSFAELLGRIKQVTIGAKEHGEVGFDKVIERMRMPRDLSRTPLFQVAMDMMPASPARDVDGLRLRYGNLGLGTSRFDIAINAFDEPDGFRLWIEYATDLFDRSTIERMFDHFARILATGVTDPTQTLSGVPMLSASELDQVLREWQGVTRPYPRELIHVQVAAQAA